MLPLIWSKEAGIKDAVIQAYRKLYLEVAEGQTYVEIPGTRLGWE